MPISSFNHIHILELETNLGCQRIAIFGLEARASDDTEICSKREMHSSIDPRVFSPLKLDVARQNKYSEMKQENSSKLKVCVVVVVVAARDESDGAYSLPLGRGP